MMGRKIVVGVTGASGAIYAKVLFSQLKKIDNQLDDVAVVFSDTAKIVWKQEIGEDFKNDFGFHIFDANDFFAPFASGSSEYDTMLIVPCSMGTLGRIASGLSNDLMTRAADVMLKENRRLILMVRETPFSLIHIENMRKILLAGGKLFPAIPSFYNQPQAINEVIENLILRLLDFSGFKVEMKRW